MARPALNATRPRRLAALMVPLVMLSVVAGCHGNKRTSMRPVYVSPSTPVVTPSCPSGNCGGGGTVVSPGAATSSGTSSSVDSAVIESGASSGLPEASTNSYLTPAPSRPAQDSGFPTINGPAAETPPTAEPGLPSNAPGTPSNVPAAPNGKGSNSNSGSIKPQSPSASMNSTDGPASRRATPPTRLRSASLREEVSRYASDPDDLFQPPKADRPWKYIVLHHSASHTGGYDSIDQEHRKRLGWQGCGYHFVIGNGTESPDGKIEIARRWVDQKNGVHCRDGKTSEVNEYGIGICLVGDLENEPPTERQIAAARALVAYLGDRYKIAADHTETHAHVASSSTTCPGRMFPAQAILGARGLAMK